MDCEKSASNRVLPFDLMTEFIGEHIGSKMGRYLSVDKRAWMMDQAHSLKIHSGTPTRQTTW